MATQKDPAALLYIANYLAATAEMDGDTMGWYTRLILHQYDKKDLPSDLDTLASLAGVKHSQYQRFEQVYNQKLKHLFVDNGKGRLENEEAKTIIQAREMFKEARSKSGNWGAIFKKAKALGFFLDEAGKDWLKDRLDEMDDEALEKAKSKQVLERLSKLYINVDTNTVTNNSDNAGGAERIDWMKSNFFNDYKLEEQVGKDCGFNPAQVAFARERFWLTKQYDENLIPKGHRDICSHFIRWCRQNKQAVIDSVSKGGSALDSDFSDVDSVV